MKIIIFHPFILGDKSFTPESANTGIAGAEETLLNISRELSRQGCFVSIYTQTCVPAFAHDGVFWHDYSEMNNSIYGDVFWCWSDNIDIVKNWLPKFPVARLRLVRVVNQQQNTRLQELMEIFDYAITQSSWLMKKFLALGSHNTFFLTNGIDPSVFSDTSSKKTPNSYFYGSDYDRGLIYLLLLWPEIRNKNPLATLDICYGWNILDAKISSCRDESQRASLKRFKHETSRLMIQPGITHHGRLGHDKVNELMNRTEIWAYPCLFPENCSTLSLKAVSAGMVPVIIRSGGLVETVKSGYFPDLSLWQHGPPDQSSVDQAITIWKDMLLSVANCDYTTLKKGAEDVSVFRIKYGYPRIVGNFLSWLLQKLA